MFVPFEEMPLDAKIWIFQADKPLENEQLQIIAQKTQLFLSSWESHQKALKTSYQILYMQFIIIAVDEQQAQASGCSIDKCIHFIQDLEQALQISLLNRKMITFLQNEHVFILPAHEIKQNLNEGILTENTIVFNNAITILDDLNKSWKQPLKASWLKRYIPSTV